MNTIQLVWKNITRQLGATTLSILLTAFGVAILAVILHTASSFEKQLNSNSKNIDLVIGAKGSPLQLILSSVYHMDNPTGNIPYAEAEKIMQSPFISYAVPLSLGDNYKGHRIVGTNEDFLAIYETKVAEGTLFQKDFEVVIGAAVAKKLSLKIGAQLASSHGLSEEGHQHDSHPFTVVGILKANDNVTDQLILCNLNSVWKIHGLEGPAHSNLHESHEGSHHEGSHDESHDADYAETVAAHQHHHGEEKEEFVKSIADDMFGKNEVEITSLLVKYGSPAARSIIPKMVNEQSQLQAASPALESARLFNLLGVGIDSLTLLAYIIMTIAGLSVFISLYTALKERKYDLAIMRSLGASQIKLFSLILFEGILITFTGALVGLIFGHIVLYYISLQTMSGQTVIEALAFNKNEFLLIVTAVGIGVIAALLPAIKAFKTTISTILSNK